MTSTPPITQSDMAHRLPPARLVDRAAHLVEAVRGRRAVHVGFVDSGCWDYHDRFDSWLHAHLDRAAAALVGLDLDEAGVARARELGFAAHAVDCSDPDAVARLGLEPAEVVVAGEVIEHLDASGPFLDGLHALVRPGGRLVVTTPNASGGGPNWESPTARCWVTCAMKSGSNTVSMPRRTSMLYMWMRSGIGTRACST